jgi:hypothetical protein
MSLVALNLLARWCRNVTVQMAPGAKSRLPSTRGSDLRDTLDEMMSEIDPFGNFDFAEIPRGESDAVLVLGASMDSFGAKAVRIDGCGWVGGLSLRTPKNFAKTEQCQENPIGPAFASCLGVAEIFRRAAGLGRSEEPSWYSLFDFDYSRSYPGELANPSLESSIDLGRILQVGCGAVASSLDQLLALTDWRGTIDLIDYDKAEMTNCNRSLSFNASDCVSNAYKADVCGRTLRTVGFQVNVHRVAYADFIKEGHYLHPPPDLILCLANEQNVWSTIQNNLPPLALHATTTRNWGTNLGRHIPKVDWCLMCRFGQELNHQFVPQCGEGQLIPESTTSPAVEGVLPFMPSISSVILLSELAKMSRPNYPINRNFVTFSTRHTDGQFVQLQKQPTENCVCNDQAIDIYPIPITSTKYWDLTSKKEGITQ